MRFSGRVLLLLFFLANSGFTLVLHRCTVEMTDCCNGSDDQMAGFCSVTRAQQSTHDQVIISGSNCRSVEIAGGLTVDPIVVEKRSAGGVLKLDLTAIFAPDITSSHLYAHHLTVSTSASPDASAPSVKTYVLNATFRI